MKEFYSLLFCGINQINRGNQEGTILVFLQSLCTGFRIAHTTTVFYFLGAAIFLFNLHVVIICCYQPLLFVFFFLFLNFMFVRFTTSFQIFIYIFCFINFSFVQSIFVTNGGKRRNHFLAYTLRHRVLSLSLSWSVLGSSYMNACNENYLMYLTYILSLSLSFSLMECARLIMYGCMR